MTRWALELYHVITLKDVAMLTSEMLLVHNDDELISSF